MTIAAMCAAALAGIALSPSPDRVVQAAGMACIDTDCGAGGEYHAMDPIRILDTRDPSLDVTPAGRKKTGPDTDNSILFNVPVVLPGGLDGMPAFDDTLDSDGFDDNVLAVAVTITVVQPTRPGFVRSFGRGATEDTTSLANFRANSVVANSVILRPGIDGELTMRIVTPAGLGSADLVIDLFGWFSTSSYGELGARLIPAGPGRLFDSREAAFGASPVRGGQQVEIPIRGADSYNPTVTDLVPNDARVVGALVNVTAVNRRPGSVNTYLSAQPDRVTAGEEPATSTVNVAQGEFRASLAIVPVGANGSIFVYNPFGETDVIVDLMAYLIEGQPSATRAGRVVPLAAPFRALDTREAEFFAQPLAPGKAEDWSFQDFVNDVRIGSDWVGPQSALIGNLATTPIQRQYAWIPTRSFLTAYPRPTDDSPPPLVSNLVIEEGLVIPNMALLKYGGPVEDPYQVRVYNRDGFVHYLLDVSAVVLADAG